MTLIDVIKAVERAAATGPAVRTIVRGDVFRLNNAKGARYCVFAWEQTTHTQDVESGAVSWGFRMFVIDRITSGHTNEIDVQSAAQQVLEGVVYALQDWGFVADNVTYTPFTQRFADDCAGMYCELSLQTDGGSLCPEDYPAEDNGTEIIYI